MEKKQTIWKKLFSGSGWALFTMFVWELIEEGIESLIAYAISSAVAVFITKALSTLAIITATQGIKVALKRFLVPLIRDFTYKEGNDKVSKIKKFFSIIGCGFKKFFTWIWANKKTLLGTVGAFVTSIATAYATYGGCFDFLPTLTLFGFNFTAVIVGVVCFILVELGVTGKGFETIKTFFGRIAEQKAQKAENAIVKEAKKELKAEKKLAQKAENVEQNSTKADAKAEAKAEAKAKVEAEKAQAKQEYRAKVDAVKQQLKAEAQSTAKTGV